MNAGKRIFSIARLLARQCHCKSSKPKTEAVACLKTTKSFKKLKSKQARFQCDDGLPIFLKAGFIDKVFYQGTLLLLLVGVGMMVKLFVELSLPKKN